MAILISKIVGYEGNIKWDNSKPDGTLRKLLDVSRLNNLGWYPKIPFEEGLKKTIHNYKKENKLNKII